MGQRSDETSLKNSGKPRQPETLVDSGDDDVGDNATVVGETFVTQSFQMS